MPDNITYSWSISWKTNNRDIHDENTNITYVSPEETFTGLNRKTIKLKAWVIPENVESILV